MRLSVWANKMKKAKGEDDPLTGIFAVGEPDYLVYQAQRTGADDGSPAYERVEVGYGHKMIAPSGEIYINLKILGLTDNKPNHGKEK